MDLSSTSRRNHAGIRTKVISKLFNALLPELQEEWKGVSKEQHDLALAEWSCKTEGPPAETPEARQSYIEATIPFMQWILDLVLRLTGMKTMFMLSSPEPADGGSWALPDTTLSLASLMDEHTEYASLISLGELSELLVQPSPPSALLGETPTAQDLRQSPSLPPIKSRQPSPCWESPALSPLPSPPGSPIRRSGTSPPIPGPQPTPPLSNIPNSMTTEALSTSALLKRAGDGVELPPLKRLKSLPLSNSSQAPAAIPGPCPCPCPLSTPTAASTAMPPQPPTSTTHARSSPSHHAPTPAPSSPPWFSSALELLSSEPTFGEEWRSLLWLWVEFESKAGYQNTQLPLRSWLWFLGQWFKNHCSNRYCPDMEQPVEAGMLTWWDLLPRDAICSSGLNGVLTLLFGLFVWRERIPAEATERGAVWLQVVGEVHSALEGM
ncbi:hypothetical protein DXG01_003718 [Tephrocybe rancida]|nr:hypothetical protein DXG01_003718 [Tephrocybe rancida]